MAPIDDALSAAREAERTFRDTFGFYCDGFDELLRRFVSLRPGNDRLAGMEATNQLVIQAYGYLHEATRTQALAAYRHLAEQQYAGAYPLLRLLYEAAAVMYFGNISKLNGQRVYVDVFKSGREEKGHRRLERKLVAKARKRFRRDNPNLAAIESDIDYYGGGLSRGSITLANPVTDPNPAAQRYQDRRLMAGLDYLFALMVLITEEYAAHVDAFFGLRPQDQDAVSQLPEHWANVIRPRLEQLGK